MTDTINNIQRILDAKIGAQCERIKQIDNLKAQADQAAADRAEADEALALARVCADQSVDAKVYVEEIITALLKAVVGPLYRFEYATVTSASGAISGYRPMVAEGDKLKPLSAWSGGENAVVNIGARLAYVLLAGLTPVLILDELNASLSALRWQRLIEALRQLGEAHGLQVVAVAHTQAEFPHTVVCTRVGSSTTVQIR